MTTRPARIAIATITAGMGVTTWLAAPAYAADPPASWDNERILDCTWTVEGENVVLKLPEAPGGGEGKVFSGTYRFEMIEEGVMKGDDPNVDEYFLRFKNQ